MAAPRSPTTLYARHPLPSPWHIRLLKLDRDDNGDGATPSSQVRCTLHVVRIGLEPAYRALSYTWGPPFRELGGVGIDGLVDDDVTTPAAAPSRTITCDYIDLLVSPNLHSALQQLHRIGEVSYIWIDALCINQDSKTERSQQVSRMNEIFSRATEVLVWLGTPIPEFDDLVWVEKEFGPQLEKLQERHGSEALLGKSVYDTAFFGVPDLVERVKGFGRFFAKCRWFSRAWILQEVVVAKHLRVLCGESEVEWSEVVALTKLFRLTNWAEEVRETTDKGDAEMRETLRSFGSCYRWQTIREVYWKESLEERLEEMEGTIGQFYGAGSDVERGYAWLFYVLSTIRYAQCSKEYPHDKIFAALGVGMRLMSGDIDRRLVPDYHLGVVDVYTNVASAIIEGSNSLFLLGHVGTPKRPSLPALPSWVPDFTQNAFLDIMELRNGRRYNASETRGIGTGFFSITGTTLQLAGYNFDQVHSICRLTTQEWQDTNHVHVVVNFATQTQPGWLSQGTSSGIETLWRTILGDTHDGQQSAPQELEENFHNYIAMFLEGYKDRAEASGGTIGEEFRRVYQAFGLNTLAEHGSASNDNSFSAWTLLKATVKTVVEIAVGRPWPTSSKDPWLLLEKIGPFFEQTMLLDRSRRLLRTERGLLVLGPVTSRPGDCVFVVDGYHVPLVLRPVSGSASFRLVGECYV